MATPAPTSPSASAPAPTPVPAQPPAPAAGPAASASASASPSAAGPAAGLVAVGFGLLMVFLAVIAWDGDAALPNLTQTIAGLVTALLGAVINPGHTVTRGAWNLLALCALLAAVSAGVAVLVFPRHVDAVPALTSAVAAFAGLYLNTSKITHVGAS
ncbi:hypothetical protein OG455_11505 [Kitasatospora sp. NBC_01287]|uniref:hypothetical protein n=1 Tax=Kitasatospora sp. NBC_01287 TaxID=2903573 RepID=UPI00225091ED|nr:hypothetical protein [Kitasatospora sp. NBC_01287]MCX4746140.1 hypothetical protein [Kitasatospora sp. NBC_01287]